MPRVTNYDVIADRFDRRYELYRYDGVRDTLNQFLGSARPSTLEVGCGTGHWLQVAAPYASRLAGVDPSMPMLERARRVASAAHLIRARAEMLPCRDASFDRLVCVNALHHFADRAVHDVTERAWLKQFIDGWLARVPLSVMSEAAE